jgi:MFS family permease
MPFLPLYFASLGMSDPADIALWSGISLGITPGMTALLAPLWGRLADRYGNKLLVIRSLVAFVVTMVMMGMVTRPWHVVALRVLQGFFAGYGALAVAMAANSAPPERMAASIGTVQTAQRLGPAVGPVVGGALAYAIGVRRTFFVSAAFYAAALVLVWFWYREPARAAKESGARVAGGQTRTRPLTFRSMLALQHLVLLMGAIFALQLVDRSFAPVLPMYLTAAGVPDSRVALYAGVLLSVGAATGAAGNLATQRLLGVRPPRTLLRAVGVTGALALVPFVVGAPFVVLVAATAVFGLAIGVGMTSAFAAAGGVLPERARSSGFGLLSSASLVGLSMSPMLSGVLARISLRSVFIVGVVTLSVLAVMVSYLMRTPAAIRRTPAVEDV